MSSKSTPEYEKRRAQLLKTYILGRSAADPEKISFKDAVYLMALYRGGGRKNSAVIKPLSDFCPSFYFSEDDECGIGQYMSDSSLIIPNPRSPMDCFSYSKEGIYDGFYIRKVLYGLNLGVSRAYVSKAISTLEVCFETGDWPDHWYGKQKGLWKEISFKYCVIYLEYQVDKISLEVEFNLKDVHSVIEDSLDYLSLAESMCLIWGVVKDTLYYLNSHPYTNSKQQLSYFKNRVNKKLKNHISGEFLLKKWDWPYFFEEYCLPRFLFDEVLLVDGFGDVATNFIKK